MIKRIALLIAKSLSVIILSGLGCEDAPLVAPSPKSASVVWSVPNPKDGIWLGGDVQPIIEGNMVYVIPDTALWCMNLATGERIWAVGIDTIKILCRRFIVDHDAIYIGDGSRVYAFRKSNGEQLWKTVVPNFTSRGLNYVAENETHLFFRRA